MNANIINGNESILELLIENVLFNTVKWINSRCRLQELDYIFALSTQVTKEFLNILVVAFPDYDFYISSIYCHQKAIVDIGLGEKLNWEIFYLFIQTEEKMVKMINFLLF